MHAFIEINLSITYQRNLNSTQNNNDSHSSWNMFTKRRSINRNLIVLYVILTKTHCVDEVSDFSVTPSQKRRVWCKRRIRLASAYTVNLDYNTVTADTAAHRHSQAHRIATDGTYKRHQLDFNSLYILFLLLLYSSSSSSSSTSSSPSSSFSSSAAATR